MAETQRTRNRKIIVAASYCAVFWFLTGQAFLFLFWPDDAGAGEVMTLPSIAVSEEYNDNVYLTRYNKVNDYITTASPAFVLDYKTSFWDWHLGLGYDYRYYAKGTKSGDNTYHVDLRNHTELIKNFFFTDVQDTYTRTSLSVTKDYTLQSTFVNQTDTNIFSVNPYLIFRNESRFTPILGYKYVDTWYKQQGAISTVDHIGYAEMTTQLSSTMTFTTGVRYTEDLNNVQNYNELEIYAGPNYTYAPNSFIFVLLGETYLTFQYASSTQRFTWDAGITYKYSTMTFAFETRSGYIPDPVNILRRVDSYVASFTKELPRTSFSISAGFYDYGSAVTNQRQTTTYQLTGTLNHALSPTLKLLMSETIERIEDYVADTVTSLWLSGVALERQMAKNLTLTLDYRYTNSYSPENYSNNYFNNRISIGLTKVF